MLKISGLTVNIGKVRILSDISLEVGAGEIVALIGPNGAGKTTLLRALSGLIPVSSGKIELLGMSIVGLRPDQVMRQGMCQIPERGRIFPFMTVLENLQLGAWTRTSSRDMEENLKRVYQLFPVLEERAKQVANTLSGGERQMLAIGRALMSRPKLLLMDEPAFGLSPLLCLRLGELIEELNKQGVSILIGEQNAVLALSVSHRGYVLETGRITLQGESSDLMHNEDVKSAYLGG